MHVFGTNSFASPHVRNRRIDFYPLCKSLIVNAAAHTCSDCCWDVADFPAIDNLVLVDSAAGSCGPPIAFKTIDFDVCLMVEILRRAMVIPEDPKIVLPFHDVLDAPP